jgi:hypothetical protein
MHSTLPLLSLVATATATAAINPLLNKRGVTWGPIVGFYPTDSEIIGTTSTIYPGTMPQSQTGYVFTWIGIGNSTGDLVQSIVGNYPKGRSECEGQAAADTAWCVSSEVYGLNDQGQTVQFVGTMTTADANYDNGIVFDYVLADRETYVWNQTMTDAVTGQLLATYQKTSNAMSLWNTAVEIQDFEGTAATALTDDQVYVNTTIRLDPADATYGEKIYAQYGATFTKPTTSDGGKTVSVPLLTVAFLQDSQANSPVLQWFVEKITAPGSS